VSVAVMNAGLTGFMDVLLGELHLMCPKPEHSFASMVLTLAYMCNNFRCLVVNIPKLIKMFQSNLIVSFLMLVCLAKIAEADAATIDPYKGRWRVDMVRTLENFHKYAPQNIPTGGFPAAILRSMKNMSLEISRKRYIFRAGKRKIINSRFEIISLSDDGVMMRINVRDNVREQLLALSPEGRLRVIAMKDGKPEPRASANYFLWYRIKRTKRRHKSKAPIPETTKVDK